MRQRLCLLVVVVVVVKGGQGGRDEVDELFGEEDVAAAGALAVGPCHVADEGGVWGGGWIASVVVVVVVEDSLRLRAFGWGRDLVGG